MPWVEWQPRSPSRMMTKPTTLRWRRWVCRVIADPSSVQGCSGALNMSSALCEELCWHEVELCHAHASKAVPEMGGAPISSVSKPAQVGGVT